MRWLCWVWLACTLAGAQTASAAGPRAAEWNRSRRRFSLSRTPDSRRRPPHSPRICAPARSTSCATGSVSATACVSDFWAAIATSCPRRSVPSRRAPTIRRIRPAPLAHRREPVPSVCATRSCIQESTSSFTRPMGCSSTDFEVAAGADSSRIALDVRGADRLYVDAAGDLVVHAGTQTLRQRRPVAYQDVGGGRRFVDASYRITSGRVRIALGPYDRRRRLVIDPSLAYSTFVGGASDDGYGDAHGAAVAVDASGAVYAAINYQPSSTGTDVFIAKFAAGTHALVYSTVVAGTSTDRANAIAVAPDGSVYVAGETISSDFPFLNAYQQGPTLSFAPFLLRLNPDGTLAFATLFSLSGSGRAVIAAPDGSAVWLARRAMPRCSRAPARCSPSTPAKPMRSSRGSALPVCQSPRRFSVAPAATSRLRSRSDRTMRFTSAGRQRRRTCPRHPAPSRRRRASAYVTISTLQSRVRTAGRDARAMRHNSAT